MLRKELLHYKMLSKKMLFLWAVPALVIAFLLLDLFMQPIIVQERVIAPEKYKIVSFSYRSSTVSVTSTTERKYTHKSKLRPTSPGNTLTIVKTRLLHIPVQLMYFAWQSPDLGISIIAYKLFIGLTSLSFVAAIILRLYNQRMSADFTLFLSGFFLLLHWFAFIRNFMIDMLNYCKLIHPILRLVFVL